MNGSYPEGTEKAIKLFYEELGEKTKRHFASLMAAILPHGGAKYVAELFLCDPKTIYNGSQEFLTMENTFDGDRKPGGGRKEIRKTYPKIDDIFISILKAHTAGDPMNEKIIWTDLTVKEIVALMRKDGILVSKKIVRKLLKKHGYVQRKIQKKKKIGKDHQDRNKQFEKIEELKKEYISEGNPIISVDGKKKENLGELFRAGTTYTKEEISSFDHDYPNLAIGVARLYGIYDVAKNEGYVSIGTNNETGEMATNAIKNWWNEKGKNDYPNATSILILADGGGCNSSSHHIFKQDLQNLAKEIGVEIRMAHFPPYTSKWNPIEHRLFPHITRSLSGLIIRSYEMILHLVKKAATKTGLKVTASIDTTKYLTGRKVDKNFKDRTTVVHDSILPKWNYVVGF